MGNLLYSSKKKNAKEQLEDIQEEIYQIDKYKLTSFLRQKNYLALVYFLFILIYPTGLVYIYFTFDSNNNRTQILYSLLFIISLPIFVYLFRKYLHLYFKWITDNNNIRLVQLLKEKKKILSKVQETETFNDAKCILEKYDPSLLRNLSLSLNNLSQIDNAPTATPIRDRRTSTFSHQQQQSQQQSLQSQNNNLNNRLTSPIRNYNQNQISGQSLPPHMNRNYMTQQQQQSSTTTNQQPGMINISATPMIGQRTIKPILPQNRSTVEKVIDYMFNDGPNNRYALICPHCLSHNGMALPDEFEYIAYICAYCGTFNPSRKIRPAAPSQQQQSQQPQTQQKAIEPPPPPTPPSPTSSSKPGNLKIVELSSVLNKTMDSTINKPTVEEPSDDHHSDNDQKSKNDQNERIRSIDSSSDDE